MNDNNDNEFYNSQCKKHRKRTLNNIKSVEEIENAVEIVKDYNNHLLSEYKENLLSHLENKKIQIAEDIQNYIENMPKKEDKDDKNSKKTKKHLSMPVITKVLGIDFAGVYGEPLYSAPEMAMIFEYYKDVIADINMKGVLLPPTRQNFCIFAGISTSTYEAYLKSVDINKQSIMQKIEDYMIENMWSEGLIGTLNPYLVEKKTKLKGIGGGYSEAKSDININVVQNNIGTPENMLDDLNKYIALNQ